MIFLKLGGSLITDKTRNESTRPEVIARLAQEIAQALTQRPQPLLLGHGSGSFGHTAAKQYDTRSGVRDAQGWRGFSHVSVAAARLNRIVADALHAAGVPVFSVLPGAITQCVDGRIVNMHSAPIHQALAAGLCPLIMGDVAFDHARGGTIISTEEEFFFLASGLNATRVLLAGETDGVYQNYDPSAQNNTVIEHISPATWAGVQRGVGGSRGADVTGGMAAKVRDMLVLATQNPGIEISIFSGMVAGHVQRALLGERIGTTVGA